MIIPWTHRIGQALTILLCAVVSGCSLALHFNQCTEDSQCREQYGSLTYCTETGLCDVLERSQLKAPCQRNYGILQPGAVPLGVILPTSGPLAGMANPVLQAMYLAVDDVNALGGINEKPLVLIICDSGGDRAKVRAAASYLTEELQVSAILGPFTATEGFAVYDIAREQKVVMISPSITDENYSDLADDGYMWRTVAVDTKQGLAMAHIIEQIITTELPKPVEEVHVAVVVDGSVYAETLRRALFGALVATGPLVIDSGPNSASQVRTILAAADGNLDNVTAADSTVFRQLRGLDPAPDIVVWLGEPDLWGPMLEYDRVRVTENSAEHLFHLMADLAKDATRAEVGRPEHEGRIWGTALQTNAEPSYGPFESFRTVFRAAWIYDPISVQFASNAWDAVYAFAIAARDSPLNGPAIQTGLGRLTGTNDRAEANRAGLQRAYNFVSAGLPFQLDGASGPLTFDLDTGDITTERDIILWCYSNSRHVELGSIFDGNQFTPRSCREIASQANLKCEGDLVPDLDRNTCVEAVEPPDTNFYGFKLRDTSTGEICTDVTHSYNTPGSQFMYAALQDAEDNILAWATYEGSIAADRAPELDYQDENIFDGTQPTLDPTTTVDGPFGCPDAVAAYPRGPRGEITTPVTLTNFVEESIFTVGCDGSLFLSFSDENGRIPLMAGHKITVGEYDYADNACNATAMTQIFQRQPRSYAAYLCGPGEESIADRDACNHLLRADMVGIFSFNVTIPAEEVE